MIRVRLLLVAAWRCAQHPERDPRRASLPTLVMLAPEGARRSGRPDRGSAAQSGCPLAWGELTRPARSPTGGDECRGDGMLLVAQSAAHTPHDPRRKSAARRDLGVRCAPGEGVRPITETVQAGAAPRPGVHSSFDHISAPGAPLTPGLFRLSPVCVTRCD